MKLLREYCMDNEFPNKRFLIRAIEAHMLLGPDFEGRHAPIRFKLFGNHIDREQDGQTSQN